jgi:PAS domain S-box-containing protein
LEKDTNGEPIKVIGIIQDITDQKKLENELRILSNAIEQNPASIVITNINGDIEYVNPKFTQVTGYTMQEALGKNPRILKSDVNPIELHTELWNNLTRGSTWRGEFCNKKKNGELYWESAVIAPVFNSFGKITHYVAVKEDITEKKDADKKIFNAIIEGEERERNRFSKELHDGLGPLLGSVKLYFQWVSKTEDLEKKHFLIEKGNHSIDEAILTLREISNNLSPQSLNTFGLVLSIKNYIEGLNQMKNININFQSNIKKRFNATIEITLYRVILELINNGLKHANAKNIYINLHQNQLARQVQLSYKDNGLGFDFGKMPANTKGNGLINIQNRINSINGKIKMNSSPGNGFEVIIELPDEVEN